MCLLKHDWTIQKTSITKKITSVDRDLPHNMSKKDMIRSTDFNFLMVLGKGSFGKVKITMHQTHMPCIHFNLFKFFQFYSNKLDLFQENNSFKLKLLLLLYRSNRNGNYFNNNDKKTFYKLKKSYFEFRQKTF